jgi:ParB family chromosome partitioning protein
MPERDATTVKPATPPKASGGRSTTTPTTQPAAATQLGHSERSDGIETVIELTTSSIVRNARQPRERFEDRALSALADSISQNGLLQPIIVRRLSVPRGTLQYELIAGERRLRAFEKLGKKSIPAIVRQVGDTESGVLALVENVQREDLNPIERATALKRLQADFGWTQQQAAERIGLDRATVANLIRLTELDPFVTGCVREGKLSQGHAKALLAVDDAQARRAVAERALHDEWSVRQIEREVQRLKAASSMDGAVSSLTPPKPRVTAQVTDLEKRLGSHLGTKVAISKGKKLGTGKLTIDFYSLDQFDGLMNRLGFDPNNLRD